MPERALLAGGTAYSLPIAAEPLAPLPLSAVPLAAPGLLGLAVLRGTAAPVFALGNGGDAWALTDGPDGPVIFAGEGLLDDAPADARPLPSPRIASRPLPAPIATDGGAWAVPARQARGLPRALALEAGAARLVLPLSALERVMPMPALRPVPGVGDLALGYALAEGEPVLVLEPAALVKGAVVGEASSLLIVFRHVGRRLGLPAARVVPARANETATAARLDELLPRLGAAPVGSAAVSAPSEPTRALLVLTVAGEGFALPVEEVAAVIPPAAPMPVPMHGGAGIVSHRGDVLPVVDAGERLGLPRVFASRGAEAPLLRLAVPNPVALAVSGVTGLRRVPSRLVTDTAGEGTVSAVATLADALLPILRAAALVAVR